MPGEWWLKDADDGDAMYDLAIIALNHGDTATVQDWPLRDADVGNADAMLTFGHRAEEAGHPDGARRWRGGDDGRRPWKPRCAAS